MFNTTSSLRVGIYGSEDVSSQESRSFALWPIGYAGAVTAAGATPVFLSSKTPGLTWDEILDGIEAVVLTNNTDPARPTTEAEGLCRWCRQKGVPILGVD